MEIRNFGIAPAFRCVLQIIAFGKHIWEHFYIGGGWMGCGGGKFERRWFRVRRLTQVKIISADYADFRRFKTIQRNLF
jgi:hypothetical protein